MTTEDFINAFNRAVMRHDAYSPMPCGVDYMNCRDVEHVTIVGDGEDFHSAETGYWGALDVLDVQS